MRAELSQLGRFDRLTPEDGNNQQLKPGHPRNAWHRLCTLCKRLKSTGGGKTKPKFVCCECLSKS